MEEERAELVSRLEKAQKEVEELKRIRREDAKANQKVASIFASQEQSWLIQKKQLQLKIEALFDEIQAQKTEKEDVVLNLNEKVQEKELVIEARDKALEEAEAKRKEDEEKLTKDGAMVAELREAIRKQAEKHHSQILKHKTAFLELVSNQRQLEAEMGRALRQVESAKQELDATVKQKEEFNMMVQQLSMEVVKIRRDSDQKEKILSALLRKTKMDREEKEMLLQELKLSKVERKRVQFQLENYKTLYESRHDQISSRGNLSSKGHSRSAVFTGSTRVHSIEADYPRNRRTERNDSRTFLHVYMETDHRDELNSIVPEKIVNVVSDSFNQYPPDRRYTKKITTDAKQLEEWVRSETEKNTTMIEHRHQTEMDAFAEQLRLKEEQSEALCWQFLSLELELEQLQSQNEGLNKSLTQLKKEKWKLETLLLEREAELKHLHRKAKKYTQKDLIKDRNANWSNVKIIKTSRSVDVPTKQSFLQMVDSEKEEQLRIQCSIKKSNVILEAPEEDIEVEKEVAMDTGHAGKYCQCSEDTKLVPNTESDGHSLVMEDFSTWKKDRHALGVSYNIKRLKQQLLLLEKFVGTPRSPKDTPRSSKDTEVQDNSHYQTKGFVAMMSILNKQVYRYQSLQEKIDDLCKKMHENDLDSYGQESKPLENFLQETLQLQRYMVAVGQKLKDIHTRIASGFISTTEVANCSSNFDMKQFSDSVSTIFSDIQKDLEVRLARLIGDIEETLTCDGIFRSQNTNSTPTMCIRMKP